MQHHYVRTLQPLCCLNPCRCLCFEGQIEGLKVGLAAKGCFCGGLNALKSADDTGKNQIDNMMLSRADVAQDSHTVVSNRSNSRNCQAFSAKDFLVFT